MTYKFLTQPLAKGLYEPEGIYLALPLAGDCRIVQAWGENSAFYSTYTYCSVPLKGHNGIDFYAEGGMTVFAVDRGRVMNIGNEPNGWGRYLKIEHSWGESLYAHLGPITVDAGQQVDQLAAIARVNRAPLSPSTNQTSAYLHFAIRIKPYNRFDGWGGFVDPIAFLNPNHLSFSQTEDSDNVVAMDFSPHPMTEERATSRRP